MAELAKKLHFLKSGTEQTAKAYSTTDEAGDNYTPLKIEGVACYAPLGATDDAMATNGRVIKGGTTYAIKSQAKPPYTEVPYTTAGTHTFTVPAGVTRLRVAVCGGGGGGVADNTERINVQTAGTGGTSSFGSLIQATGGTGAKTYEYYTEDSDGYEVRKEGMDAGVGGSPNGNKGTVYYKGFQGSVTYADGGAGFALSFTKTTGTYGQGGSTTSRKYGAGGGSGGYNTNYVNVTSNTTYTVTVGGGGAKAQPSSADATAVAGNSGFVFIAYGGDI